MEGAEAVGNDKPDPPLTVLVAGCEGSERDEPGVNELKEDMVDEESRCAVYIKWVWHAETLSSWLLSLLRCRYFEVGG